MIGIRHIALLTGAALALAACGQNRGYQPLFDGVQFRGKAERLSDDRREFAATARPVSRSLEGAREAARFQATKYCIRNFGSSRVDWTYGPDDAEDALQIEDDTLRVRGACTG